VISSSPSGVRLKVRPLAAYASITGLPDIDVGLTYLENDPLSRIRTVPLYRERYVLITHETSGFSELKSRSCAKAATLPCAF